MTSPYTVRQLQALLKEIDAQKRQLEWDKDIILRRADSALRFLESGRASECQRTLIDILKAYPRKPLTP